MAFCDRERRLERAWREGRREVGGGEPRFYESVLSACLGLPSSKDRGLVGEASDGLQAEP